MSCETSCLCVLGTDLMSSAYYTVTTASHQAISQVLSPFFKLFFQFFFFVKATERLSLPPQKMATKISIEHYPTFGQELLFLILNLIFSRTTH